MGPALRGPRRYRNRASSFSAASTTPQPTQKPTIHPRHTTAAAPTLTPAPTALASALTKRTAGQPAPGQSAAAFPRAAAAAITTTNPAATGDAACAAVAAPIQSGTAEHAAAAAAAVAALAATGAADGWLLGCLCGRRLRNLRPVQRGRQAGTEFSQSYKRTTPRLIIAGGLS